MATEPPDMSAPVTRAEFKTELEGLETRLEARLDARFEARLELWGGALMERDNALERRMNAGFEQVNTRLDQIVATIATLGTPADLARHTNALFERFEAHLRVVDDKYNHLPARIAAVDDKYADLPARVTRLEDAVVKRSRKR